MGDTTTTTQQQQPAGAGKSAGAGDDTAAAGLAAVLGGPPSGNGGNGGNGGGGGVTTPPKPGPADDPGKGGATDPTTAAGDSLTLKAIQGLIEQTMKPYVEKLQQVEGTNAQREAERRANDARDTFIREKMDDMPREIVRAMMPATEDKGQLAAAESKLREVFIGWLKGLATQGKIRIPDVGGANREGGIPPSQWQPPKPKGLSPQQGLAAELDGGGRTPTGV